MGNRNKKIRCTVSWCHAKAGKNGFCKHHQSHAFALAKEIESSKQKSFGISPVQNIVVYSEYILSDEWKKKSDIAKKKNPRCSLCNRTVNLNSHHRTYKRLGREAQDDLTVLCENCHYIFHKFYMYSSKEGCFVPIKENAVLLMNTEYTRILEND